MRPGTRRPIAILCIALAVAACGASRQSGRAGQNRDFITQAEFLGTHHRNAYNLIQSIRPHWLEIRGASRDRKQVYVDEVHMGGIEQLRQVPLSAIEYIRYYDGPSATQQWGTGHSAGAIQVRMRHS